MLGLLRSEAWDSGDRESSGVSNEGWGVGRLIVAWLASHSEETGLQPAMGWWGGVYFQLHKLEGALALLVKDVGEDQANMHSKNENVAGILELQPGGPWGSISVRCAAVSVCGLLMLGVWRKLSHEELNLDLLTRLQQVHTLHHGLNHSLKMAQRNQHKPCHQYLVFLG